MSIDLTRLREVKGELRIETLKIMCSGEKMIDWRDLLDLQILKDGRSLKLTDDSKIVRLAESLLRFGIVNNLQVWFDKGENCYCFDAHHRRKAFEVLNDIGLDIPPLPATRCLAENMIEAKKLLLVKESKSSWVDIEVVPDFMEEIGFDIEIASHTVDFPEFTWELVVEKSSPQKEEKDLKADKVPEISEKSVIRKGDLIELGKHRLLCGDSTSMHDVEKLMDGQKCQSLLTDPPYCSGGFQEAGKVAGSIGTRGTDMIANDTLSTRGYQSLIKQVLLNWSSGLVYVFTDWRMWVNLFDVVEGSGYGVKNMIVWNKESPGMGHGWRHQHELVLVGSRIRSPFNPKKAQGNVISCKRTGNVNHPTEKPVELLQKIINVSDIIKSIGDPFLGSGTTMIAAEKTGRFCFGMEIDEHYCQVAIQRWCDYVEMDIVKINGQTVQWSDYKKV